MEATKNPKTDAQRDQHLAVCRHTHDNIIFNYGSVENYIAAKNTEINTAESKLLSYCDNPRKGKSRRSAIIAGLENTIFIMKNSLANTLRELEELNAATPTETPRISTETAETVNVSAEGGKEEERAEIAITSITQLNVLKYKLQHPKLKEWAVKYGLLDLVRRMYYLEEVYIGGVMIDNKFRQSLCENDKAIIAAVRKLIADAEKAA